MADPHMEAISKSMRAITKSNFFAFINVNIIQEKLDLLEEKNGRLQSILFGIWENIGRKK